MLSFSVQFQEVRRPSSLYSIFLFLCTLPDSLVIFSPFFPHKFYLNSVTMSLPCIRKYAFIKTILIKSLYTGDGRI